MSKSRCVNGKMGHRRSARCPRHNERFLKTVDVRTAHRLAPSAPSQGKDPDLLAPWKLGTTLISGGPCGDVAGQGVHRDFNGRWTDDTFAIDFGECGPDDYGREVVAAHSGVVRVAGYDPDYGWTVVIERPSDGLATRYAHLTRDLRVRVRAHVAAGETLGTIGTSGLGNIPGKVGGNVKARAHLHFAVYSGRRPHSGVEITSVAGRKPCDNCRIKAVPVESSDDPLPPTVPPPAPAPPPPAPPAPQSPVKHYECLDEQSPLSRSLDRTDAPYPQKFTTAGSVITQVLLKLKSLDSVDRSVSVGIYTQPTASAANLLGEQTVFAPFVEGSAPEVQATFDKQIETAPGTDLYLLVKSLDRPVTIYMQHSGTAAVGCLIGAILGRK
jgi:hypothetical protein